MGRRRQLVLGAINITLPAPHEANRYIRLFQHALAEKQKVALQGDWVGLLGSATVETSESGKSFVRGEFYKYINLVATRDWFNVEKGKPANAQELGAIVIPDELKPHFQFFPFVFFPSRHRLVLITKDATDTLSTRQAAAILTKIFNSTSILTEFGRVDVVIEPSRETLDTIFSLPRLRSLEILVTPPNPDDFEEFERDLYKGMEKQRAGSYKIVMHESDSRGLAPDEGIRKIAEVAQSNGKVVGIGGSRGKTKKVSTTDHPLVEKTSYNPDTELRTAVLFEKAKELLQRLRR